MLQEEAFLKICFSYGVLPIGKILPFLRKYIFSIAYAYVRNNFKFLFPVGLPTPSCYFFSLKRMQQEGMKQYYCLTVKK